MNFIDIIKERGFVHQMTDEAGLAALLQTPGPCRAYIGFDCTAKSLHVGSLMQIMLLRWWQKCGHTPIVLLGGGTTKIGDPSGKDESRPRLDDAMIAENMVSLREVFAKFLDFSSNEAPANTAIMVNNDDWLAGLNYVDFLRDYGRHFSVNRMLTMDSVKLRLEREQPLSFLEFNYMILQAYDFVELHQRHQCRVQLGGADQWGNIINGVDLFKSLAVAEKDKAPFKRKHSYIPDRKISVDDVQKKPWKEIAPALADKHVISYNGLRDTNSSTYESLQIHYCDDLFGITSPLLTTASGAKMGKTAAGAVWLNADLLKPYDYWQFWRNTEDADVEKFLKLFTELSLEDIAKFDFQSASINEAKKVLATEATAMLHGREAAEKAAQTAADIFAGSGVSSDLETHYITEVEFEGGAYVYSYFGRVGWPMSNGEIKRLIQNGGVRVNDVVVTDEKARLTKADFAQGFVKLSKGKKQHVLLKIK